MKAVILIILSFLISLSGYARRDDVGCTLTGTSPRSTYQSATYSLNGSACSAVASWSVTCGSIVSGSETSTSVAIYFNSTGCTQSVITALNSSGGTIASITVTVNSAPALSGGTISTAAQWINYNTTPSLISASPATYGSCEGYSYSWLASTDNANFYPISGATDQNYQPGQLTTNTYFKRRVDCGYQWTTTTNSVLVNVYPQLSAGTITPSSQTVNYGTSPSPLSVSAPSGGTGSYTYQWQSAFSSNGTYSAINGATGASYSPPALSQNTYYKVAVSSNEAVATSASVVVNVQPGPVIIQGTLDPAVQWVNYNGAVILSFDGTISGGNGTYSYRWYRSYDGTSWSQIPTEVNNYVQITNITADNYFYFEVTSNGSTVTTNSVIVHAYPELSAGTLTPSAMSYNAADGPPYAPVLELTGTSGGNGIYTYQWQLSEDVNFSNPTNVGNNGVTYTPAIPTTTTYFRVLVISNGSTKSSTPAEIKVYPPIDPGTLFPSQIKINYNTLAPFQFTPPSGGNGMYVREFESSLSREGPFAIDPLIDVDNPIAHSVYVRARITSNGNFATTNVVRVIVYPPLALDLSPQQQYVAIGVTPVQLVGTVTGGNDQYTYQWSNSTNGTSWSPISGVTTNSYTPPVSTTSMYYRLTVTSNGVSQSATATVTLVESLYGGNMITLGKTIQEGASPGVLLATVATQGACSGNYNYDWEAKSSNDTDFSSTGGTLQNYTPGNLSSTTTFRRKVTCGNQTAYTGEVVISVTPSPSYIRIREVEKEGITSLEQASLLSDPDVVNQNTEYIDGLGRTLQSVGWRSSPEGQDQVIRHQYDGDGKESQQYLPYISSATNGAYRPLSNSEQSNFNSSWYPQEQNFYQKTTFEKSPLGRPISKYAPGSAWGGSQRGVAFSYSSNSLDDHVINFVWNSTTASISAGTPFVDGRLFKNTSMDENQHAVIEFVDKERRTICKKVQSSKPDEPLAFASTYYIYDDSGNLVLVLPPEGVEKLKTALNLN